MDIQRPERTDFREETQQQFSAEIDAFLTLENNKVVLINQPIFNIGRRIENNLALNDPRVSRIHAQLRPINGVYVLFDLGSTGGTFINGRQIEQSIIYSGDVISLAGVTMIFQQKVPAPRPDLKDTDKLMK
jgi:pSer/pThr/pTyr-binding forkhead associated (FHA) protein